MPKIEQENTVLTGVATLSVARPEPINDKTYDVIAGLVAKLPYGISYGQLHIAANESALEALDRRFSGNSSGILNDKSISNLCKEDTDLSMITPFAGKQVRKTEDGRKILSYGLSSMGYDVRLGSEFKIFSNIHNAIIDPCNMQDNNYVDKKPITDETGTYVMLPPNSYLLGVTMETFDIPPDVLAICIGKSTYARAGALVNVTPIEPGFKGTVVIEIANLTTSPMKIYAEQGVAQFVFFRSSERCAVSYADRGGKYQNQAGVQTAIV